MSDEITLCIPPDPSVGGWWWLGYADKNNEFPLWWEADGKYWENGFDAERATAYGYRILGPVTPHAEVEALRAEIQRLRAGLFGVRALIADCSGIPPLRNSLEQLVLAEIDAIAIGGTTP